MDGWTGGGGDGVEMVRLTRCTWKIIYPVEGLVFCSIADVETKISKGPFGNDETKRKHEGYDEGWGNVFVSEGETEE